MSTVVDCGFTDKNCFGTDIFPVRIQNSHLRNVSMRRNPFEAYPQFKGLFLKDHLGNVLKYGGKVLLVFGNIAFEAMRVVLRLKEVELRSRLGHLKIYCQMVLSDSFWVNMLQEKHRIERLVIHVYHPRYFLPDDIYDSESDEEPDSDIEDEMDEEMERKILNARRMDESFNLAAYLTGISLPSQTFWTDYVLENYGESSDMDEGENFM
jgi:hypothetical protein